MRLLMCSVSVVLYEIDYGEDELEMHLGAVVSVQDVVVQTDSAKALADSLDRAQIKDFPYFNTLLRILATRCMMQAVYFCSGMDSDFHHYGLASPIYTHFTSPIRRSEPCPLCLLPLTQQSPLSPRATHPQPVL